MRVCPNIHSTKDPDLLLWMIPSVSIFHQCSNNNNLSLYAPQIHCRCLFPISKDMTTPNK
jgi:hypothetical protein